MLSRSQMRGLTCLSLALLAALLESGCTFYTSCPSGNGNTGNGSGGSGNTGNNGSGGVGASVSVGGAVPMGDWTNETLNLAAIPSQCGNLSYLSRNPLDDSLIACVGLHGLYSKAPDGTEWDPLGTGKGSDQIVNRANTIVYDPDNAGTYYEAGIYNSFGVYKTTDNGVTFTNMNVSHDDSVGIDFSDPDRKTLLASGHEQVHKLYLTTDAGKTWQEIGDNLPSDVQVCGYPVVLDSATFLLGCGNYGGGMPGILRSEDGGMTWARVSDHGGGALMMTASDGTMYWASVNTDGIVKSTDQGKTWSDALGAGQLLQVAPVELPDGRIAAVGKAEVVISEDQGEHWTLASAPYPTSKANSSCSTPPCDYDPLTLAYSNKQFHISHWTCGTEPVPVPDDAVLSFPFE